MSHVNYHKNQPYESYQSKGIFRQLQALFQSFEFADKQVYLKDERQIQKIKIQKKSEILWN